MSTELEQVREDLQDAMIALANATRERQEASKWEDKMLLNYKQLEEKLEVLAKLKNG